MCKIRIIKIIFNLWVKDCNSLNSKLREIQSCTVTLNHYSTVFLSRKICFHKNNVSKIPITIIITLSIGIVINIGR
jgi:hypothetical protein